MENYSIYHNLVIQASAQKIYEAISDPIHLVNWWPEKCSGSPALGNTYNFVFTAEYDWYGTVSKCETDKSFHIKMTKSDKDWNPTSFGFDLEESNGSTAISFSHVGWPACNQEFKQSSYCWAILLKGLKDYVENGIIVPFENRE